MFLLGHGRLFLQQVGNRRISVLGLGQLLNPVTFRSFCSGIKEESFAASYLINSLGFSYERAILASRKLKFENSDGPNAVLDLFRDNGFSESQISKLFHGCPVLLTYDPKGTLLPKIEFLYSVGFTRNQVSRLCSSKPSLLSNSLKNTIIPWYNFLKSLLLSNEKVFTASKSPSWSCYGDVQTRLAPNIAFLRQLGVPESRISMLLCRQPKVFIKKHEDLKKSVDKVIEMGFHPSRATFIIALIAFSKNKTSTLEQKKGVYRGYGWSENDIQIAFRAHPQTLCLSENKIKNVMDFLVKSMDWPMSEIVRNPTLLFFNLEKRIKPRCSVIQVLVSKGLVEKDIPLKSVLRPKEMRFLDEFVTSFQRDVPQLLGVYQGKVSASELLGKV